MMTSGQQIDGLGPDRMCKNDEHHPAGPYQDNKSDQDSSRGNHDVILIDGNNQTQASLSSESQQSSNHSTSYHLANIISGSKQIQSNDFLTSGFRIMNHQAYTCNDESRESSSRILSSNATQASSRNVALLPPSYTSIPGTVPYFQCGQSGPPPSYDDVINPEAAPPTYQSLFGQLRDAHKSSSSLMDLLERVLVILLSTLGFTIVLALMLLVPSSMIIVGATHIDQCRVEHLPAFLLFGGLVWAAKNLLHCYIQCQGANCDPDESGSLRNGPRPWTTEQVEQQLQPNELQQQQQQVTNQRSNEPQCGQDSPRNWPTRDRGRRLKSSICASLLNCMLFGWFIAGCIIVFRSYEPNYTDPNDPRFCNRTVYLFAFWLISSICLIFGLIITSICILLVSSTITNRYDFDDSD